MKTQESEKEDLEQYCSNNEPNAAILIYALQHLGYKNEVALCDIIDNAIDAGATNIRLYIEQTRIMVVDNGSGMERDVLDQALRLGSDVIREDASCLGKFGMGLSTASLSIANRTTVLTKTKNSNVILKTATDVNVINKTNRFVKYLNDADEKGQALFKEFLGDEPSGTIILLEECTGVKVKNITQFSNKMKNEIARIYRKFMGKITFQVNDTTVHMYDPLYLNEKGTEVYSDEDYEVKWKDKHGIEKKAVVHAKLVLLPLMTKDEARDQKINIPNQGFSVLRNSREIAFGYIPNGWLVKHNRFNRFRGEISFQSDVDEAMGVDFTKDGIDMIDSVNDILQNDLRPQIIAIANKAEKEVIRTENEKINHEEAAKQINTRSNILILPKEEKAEANEEENEEKSKVNVKFETISSGRAGNIFSAYMKGKTTVIQWNIDHPFYESFVVSNKDNTKLVSAVDYLIYSIATSQLKVLGDDNHKAEIIDQLISVMSNNMRALLN